MKVIRVKIPGLIPPTVTPHGEWRLDRAGIRKKVDRLVAEYGFLNQGEF